MKSHLHNNYMNITTTTQECLRTHSKGNRAVGEVMSGARPERFRVVSRGSDHDAGTTYYNAALWARVVERLSVARSE